MIPKEEHVLFTIIIFVIHTINNVDGCIKQLPEEDCRAAIAAIADSCGTVRLCSSPCVILEHCSPHPVVICEFYEHLTAGNLLNVVSLVFLVLFTFVLYF